MKKGLKSPPLSIIQKGKTTHAHEVRIDGPSTVVYSPAKPLSCGARIWIETEAEVITI